MKVKMCRRCGNRNTATNKVCVRCGLKIGKKSIIEVRL